MGDWTWGAIWTSVFPLGCTLVSDPHPLSLQNPTRGRGGGETSYERRRPTRREGGGVVDLFGSGSKRRVAKHRKSMKKRKKGLEEKGENTEMYFKK